MKMAARIMLLGGALAATAAVAEPAAMAGNWSQSSSGKELVLVPKIKLQPNVGVGYGTNLGGSVGMGSATRTTIVTEPTMLDVTRSMTLSIAANGAFEWSITKRYSEDKCLKTTRQVKRGTATMRSGKMSFAVSGGTESFEKSCGGSGSAAIAPSTEVYDVTVQGGQMRLSGGSTNWTFRRS